MEKIVPVDVLQVPVHVLLLHPEEQVFPPFNLKENNK